MRTTAPVATPLGPVERLTFLPADHHDLIPGHHYLLAPRVSLQKALQGLADQLPRSHFNADQELAADIRIDVCGLHGSDLPHRPLRVVIVNLHDARQAVWRSFFQGSTGGQTTYGLLAATLMHPQRTPPLAEGRVVLYNGKAFPERDPIRFRGIVSAESVRPPIFVSIQRRPPRPDSISG